MEDSTSDPTPRTICAECRHCDKTRGLYSGHAAPEWWKCNVSVEDRFDYVTGGTESMRVYCNLKNYNGRCPDFAAAEGAPDA